ncbi:hypothetical protein [Streptomyces chiangmaiensis]|uniref:SH3 domain-containing protein n=1 Tax=Streptomyces chiangmaiensis TaxID=766497 RepID=A0ABU7FCH7_9ACTN|nr:hypothetical protein [Streptomyces chiangmaiensis]MED7821871.1 hypothetical protein [Streptomyces chiangmaiensis]
MKSSLRTRSARLLPVGALSVALLATGAAGAFAAPAPQHSATTVKTATMASISVNASRTELQSGESVTFTGAATGLKIGDTLSLQRYDGTKWVTVKTVKVAQGNTYTFMATKLTTRGSERFRVSHGATVSPTVIVSVN